MYSTKKSLPSLMAVLAVTAATVACTAEEKAPATAVATAPQTTENVVAEPVQTYEYTNLVTGEKVTYTGDPMRYLEPERVRNNPMGIARADLADPSNPYSAEVPDEQDGGLAGNTECKVPNAFAAVHINAEKNYNAEHKSYGYGTPITDAAIKPWDIDVDGSGRGLPDNSVGMTIEEGEQVYVAYCAMCHGEFGESAKGYLPLVGDWSIESLDDDFAPAPFRSIGNFWPFGTTMFDYIRRTMPFWAPNNPAIGDAGYMGIVGFLAYANEIAIDADGNTIADLDTDTETFFNAEMLMKIDAHMPARDRFFCDDRPVVQQDRCMNDCPDAVVGNGKGDVQAYRGPKILPNGQPQYNTGPDAIQKGPRYAGEGREPE